MKLLLIFLFQVLNNISVFIYFWFLEKHLPMKAKYAPHRRLIVFAVFFLCWLTGILRYWPLTWTTVPFLLLTAIYFASELIATFVCYEGLWSMKLFLFVLVKILEAILINLDEFVHLLLGDSAEITSQSGGYMHWHNYVISLGVILLEWLLCWVILSFSRMLRSVSFRKTRILEYVLIPLSQAIFVVGGSFLLRTATYGSVRAIYSGVFALFILLALVGDALLFKNIREQREKAELEKRVALMESLQDQSLAELRHSNEVTRRQHMINHDLKNHLITASRFLDTDDYAAAKRYLEEISALMRRYDDTICCGHQTINSVLNYKKYTAEAEGVALQYDIHLPEALPFSDVDVCSIFTNVLDNALNAAKQLAGADKMVQLRCEVRHGFFLLREENPVAAVPQEAPEPAKDEVSVHGLGLQILRFIADKYEGTLNCGQADGVYLVEFSAPLNRAQAVK